MTTIDAMGYVAASLVLAAFCAKRMVSLRALAIASNLAFIAYGLPAHLWPIVLLHLTMLPLNIMRLREALAGDEWASPQRWCGTVVPVRVRMPAARRRVE